MKSNEPQSYLTRSNLEYLEQVYEEFKKNPKSIDREWMRFFEGIEFAKEKDLKSIKSKIH